MRIKKPPPRPTTNKSEQWYPLLNDPALHATGVEIGARMIPQAGRPPKMHIVFRAGGRKASVTCVHMAVYVGSLKSHQVHLTPVEHYFALKSFVAGIAEVGLGAMFAATREARDISVGFNDLMQYQVLRALLKVAPAPAFDLGLWILDEASKTGTKQDSDVSYFAHIAVLLADNNNTPPEVLARLAEQRDDDVRSAVACNLNTPPEVLARLAATGPALVRERVAGNLNICHLPHKIIESLSRDRDTMVRYQLARNGNTPSDMLSRLAGDQDEIVRREVANLRSTPTEALARLAGDNDKGVRVRVAGNKNTPVEIMRRLAQDDDVGTRMEIAGNDNSPKEILSLLARDSNKDVRRIVARNKNTPLEVLAGLGHDPDSSVRKEVATNERTPGEALEYLGHDPDSTVRKLVIMNKHTPIEIILRLRLDVDRSVRELANDIGRQFPPRSKKEM